MVLGGDTVHEALRSSPHDGPVTTVQAFHHQVICFAAFFPTKLLMVLLKLAPELL